MLFQKLYESEIGVINYGLLCLVYIGYHIIDLQFVERVRERDDMTVLTFFPLPILELFVLLVGNKAQYNNYRLYLLLRLVSLI